MILLISALFVGSTIAAVLGWVRAVKLDQKLANSKRRATKLEAERAFLLSQTTQLAQENVELKSRLSALGAPDAEMKREESRIVQSLQQNRSETASLFRTGRTVGQE